MCVCKYVLIWLPTYRGVESLIVSMHPQQHVGFAMCTRFKCTLDTFYEMAVHADKKEGCPPFKSLHS